MKDPYSILGISSTASDKEVKDAYRALARKYHPDNYGDDNPLKDLANEKMQEINSAYDEIQRMRSDKGNSRSGASYGYGSSYTGDYTYGGSSTGIYADIRRSLNANRFAEAERMLAGIPMSERTADWHYLTCIILRKQGRINDAMRELEIACDMDPGNYEYQKAKEMFNTSARGYGSTYYGGGNTYYRRRSSTDDACDCCANLICLDCLCECLGGDLIRCI